MLTRNLLRFKEEGGRIRPMFLKPTPAVQQVAERLLRFWREGIGTRRAELDEQSGRICYQARSLVMARGLQKLLVDACRFDEPADVAEARWRALAASAERLQLAPAATPEEHRRQVEDDIGVDDLRQSLYADLPSEARLAQAPDWSAEELLARYNHALVQGLMLGAEELTVRIADRSPGLRRRLIKQLRFHRLLATGQQSDAGLELQVSGPGAVLDQQQRYGLQLALFLPAVATASRWSVSARVRPKPRAKALELSLDQSAPLRGDERFLAYVPEELRDLAATLAGKRPDWRWIDDAPLLQIGRDGELVAPDLAIAIGERRIEVEFFHRWHRAPLLRRLRQLAAGEAPRLLVAVDRAVGKNKEVAEALADPALATRHFLFNGFPAPTTLIRTIEALIAADKG